VNLSCKRATELLSEEQDRDLSFQEWTALQAHLVICKGCRAVSGQFKVLRRALQSLLDKEKGV
jgi:predicted anti-sigma-YlaC factor YlaD